ncbi:MAG: hypothetical protein AAFV93_06415 [Chloroflexota bacterium]
MSFLISLVLTLIVFSYLLDDNPLFRLAVSLFIGLAAAFTVTVTLQSVILPVFNSGFFNGVDVDAGLFVFALILTILLLLKPFRSLRILTNFSLGFLIAVGVAVSIIGAISGTLIPLVSATADIDMSGNITNLISQIILVIGVITSLMYFNYSARQNETGEIVRGSTMQVIAGIGQGFIVITLGALYGAAILTSLTILTGQLATLFNGL